MTTDEDLHREATFVAWQNYDELVDLLLQADDLLGALDTLRSELNGGVDPPWSTWAFPPEVDVRRLMLAEAVARRVNCVCSLMKPFEEDDMMTSDNPYEDAYRAVAAWQSYEALVSDLLFTAQDLAGGLELVRCQLNGLDASSWWTSLPPEVDARRLLLLDGVARRLAVLRGLDSWPIPSDLLDVAPDDASTLDENLKPG